MDSATSKIMDDNDKFDSGNGIARIFNKLCDDQVDSKKGVIEGQSLLPSPESLCTEDELDLVESRHKTKGESEIPKCAEGVTSCTVGAANLDSKTCNELKTTMSRKNREDVGNSCDLSPEPQHMDEIVHGQDITVGKRVPRDLNQRGRRVDESCGKYDRTSDGEELEESVRRFHYGPGLLGNCQQSGNMEASDSPERDTPHGCMPPHRYNHQLTEDVEELDKLDRDTPHGCMPPHRYNHQPTGEQEELDKLDRDTPHGCMSSHRYNHQPTEDVEELYKFERDASECRMTFNNRATHQNRLQPIGSEVNYQNLTSAKGQNKTFPNEITECKKRQSQKNNSNNPTLRYEEDSPGSKNCVASVEFSKWRRFDDMDSCYDEETQHISRPLELNNRYMSINSVRRPRSMRVGSYIESEESSCRGGKSALFRQGTRSKIHFGDSSESPHDRSIFTRSSEFSSASSSSPLKSKSCKSEVDCHESTECTKDLLSSTNCSKIPHTDVGLGDSSMFTRNNDSFLHIYRHLHAPNDQNCLNLKAETNDSFRTQYDEILREYPPRNPKRMCQTDLPLESTPTRKFMRKERARSLRRDESTVCYGYEPKATVKSDSVQEQTDIINQGLLSKHKARRHYDVELKDHPGLFSCDKNFEDNKNMGHLISAVSAKSDDISRLTLTESDESNNRQEERSSHHKTNITLANTSVCASIGADTYKKSDQIHSDWSCAQKLRSEGSKDCNGIAKSDSYHIHRAIRSPKPREARKHQSLRTRQEKISEAYPEMAPDCPNTDQHPSNPDKVVKTRRFSGNNDSIDLKRASNPKFNRRQVVIKRVYDKPEIKTQGEENSESCVFIQNNDMLIKTGHTGTATEKQEATSQGSLKTVGSSRDQNLSSIYREREKPDSKNFRNNCGSKGKDFPSDSRVIHPETTLDGCFDSTQTNSHDLKLFSQAQNTFRSSDFDQTKSLHIHATTGIDALKSGKTIPVDDSAHDQDITTRINTVMGRNTNSGRDEPRDYKDLARKTPLTDENTNTHTISPPLRSPLPSQHSSKDTSPASIQKQNIIKARGKSSHTSKRRNGFTLASPESLCTDDEPDIRPKSSKRGRTVIAGRQLDALISIFQKTPFPNAMMREEIGYSLGIKPRTVQIWFQNQRQKTKTVLKDGRMYCPQLSMYRSSKNGEFALLDLLSDAADLVYRERDVLERLGQIKKQTE